MTRKIIKRLFDTYECGLANKNTFAIEYNESTVNLTEDEIALLTKSQEDNTINKELETILKKFTSLFYLGNRGGSCYLYILTPRLRSAPVAMRTFMGITGKTMELSKAEHKYLYELMRADTP